MFHFKIAFSMKNILRDDSWKDSPEYIRAQNIPPLLFFQSLPSIRLPFFPPSSCSLFDEKKSDARRRYKTATNGIKSRFLKDLPCLTSAATTFTTIFIVFLPRHYRVSSRLCSPTIKKVHSKKSVHPGPSLKASPSPEMTRKREWNTRTLARLFFLHTSKLSFVSFFFSTLWRRRKKRKRERSETFIWCLRRRIYRAT